MPSFFFNDRAPPETSPLPLPDALPILVQHCGREAVVVNPPALPLTQEEIDKVYRSEEHTSELLSPLHLVCLLFFLMIGRPPRPPLFPYPTLFRSWCSIAGARPWSSIPPPCR